MYQRLKLMMAGLLAATAVALVAVTAVNAQESDPWVPDCGFVQSFGVANYVNILGSDGYKPFYVGTVAYSHVGPDSTEWYSRVNGTMYWEQTTRSWWAWRQAYYGNKCRINSQNNVIYPALTKTSGYAEKESTEEEQCAEPTQIVCDDEYESEGGGGGGPGGGGGGEPEEWCLFRIHFDSNGEVSWVEVIECWMQ